MSSRCSRKGVVVVVDELVSGEDRIVGVVQ